MIDRSAALRASSVRLGSLYEIPGLCRRCPEPLQHTHWLWNGEVCEDCFIEAFDCLGDSFRYLEDVVLDFDTINFAAAARIMQ